MAANDRAFVRQEQGLVQEMLDALSPDGYAQIISEVNSVLNLGGFENFGSDLLENDVAYRNIISQVRNDLGRDLDFGDINDRIAIGDAVMSAIREDSKVICTGSRIRREQC